MREIHTYKPPEIPVGFLDYIVMHCWRKCVSGFQCIGARHPDLSTPEFVLTFVERVLSVTCDEPCTIKKEDLKGRAFPQRLWLVPWLSE